ncbi:sugar ABC transporter ATP-binding protein [Pseudoclavibacter chungangensis]|uniref:Sugar ABC transporter ATP-binding protein n=1 Tax=Pseudoclavibacter chungangensis TaxID=587635 RepID=A0A7J5BUQ4_9MICO|nr:sugar ABC transporter ATP-binding protein [Pseudoclavibacter chungangensis]KAB1658018.1 sugar ABC transporter ATP-binding protein [Pseudoclavibacter chungangensis]NYJ65817.1 ribose transport system ATP-binding protein [Pseudoclavibacter chungangensis]
MSGQPVLELRGVSKSFPGVAALTDVSIEIRPHQVLGLIGENGAGKSTLLKMLTGLEQPDTGELLVRGERVALRGVTAANAQGIAMVFQEQSLLENMLVGENVLLGTEGPAVRFGVYRWGQIRRRAQHYLDVVGGDLRAGEQTSRLSFAKRQMVEVAKALATGEHGNDQPVILLDEPTSVLEHDEIRTLFRIVRELTERASVAFVSHRLEEVLELCDRVYVMRDGQVVHECVPREVGHDELFALMVGRDASEGYYHDELQRPADPDTRVEVRGASAGAFEDVSFSIARGEVLTIMGVQESGREDIGRALFGAIPLRAGSITIDGEAVAFRSPADAVRAGIGYVPSERKVDGAVLGMSVAENLVLAHPEEVSVGPVLSARKEREAVAGWTERLRIKTPSPTTPIRNLSGGNQQKVVLAKWLQDPDLRLLVLDTPTRGLDVGAKADVYALVRELAAKGLAVLLIADTLEEGIAMGHRVLTMKDCRITGESASTPDDRPDRAALLERRV